jgi:hypothetical protein
VLLAPRGAEALDVDPDPERENREEARVNRPVKVGM